MESTWAKSDDTPLSGTWFIVLGVVSLILGVLGFIWASTLSQVFTVFFGALLFVAGIFQAIYAVRFKEWKGIVLNSLLAILQVVTGILIFSNPLMATVMLTLVIAMYLIVGGLFRVFWGLSSLARGNNWVVFSGMISTLLGLAVWTQWPFSGLWFIGLAIAIDLFVDGVQWLFFGFSLNKQRRATLKHA